MDMFIMGSAAVVALLSINPIDSALFRGRMDPTRLET